MTPEQVRVISNPDLYSRLNAHGIEGLSPYDGPSQLAPALLRDVPTLEAGDCLTEWWVGKKPLNLTVPKCRREYDRKRAKARKRRKSPDWMTRSDIARASWTDERRAAQAETMRQIMLEKPKSRSRAAREMRQWRLDHPDRVAEYERRRQADREAKRATRQDGTAA
jgi:hypothetical protein